MSMHELQEQKVLAAIAGASGGGGGGGLTDAQLRATPVPVSSTATQKQYAGVPSSFAIQTADGTVFTLAAGEIGFIQNLDTDPLAVKKGASASPTSLSFVLAGCTAADDVRVGHTKSITG